MARWPALQRGIPDDFQAAPGGPRVSVGFRGAAWPGLLATWGLTGYGAGAISGRVPLRCEDIFVVPVNELRCGTLCSEARERLQGTTVHLVVLPAVVVRVLDPLAHLDT